MRRLVVTTTLGVIVVVASVVMSPRVVTSAGAGTTSGTAHLALPAPVCAPSGASRCATWRRSDTWSKTPSVYTTSFRPAAQPGVVAYAAWIRSSSTQLALYPGYEGPGATTLSRGPEMVPSAARGRLLATFNSGFYEADRPGGFYVNHILYFPMIRGLATVVRYTNGTVNVVTWRQGARPGSNVLMARQNLPLLVARARPSALSANNAAWGLTLHGVPDVWRTALGVDAHGNLIYAAAPAQTSASLASIMVALHCVRAMQLDINPEWPILVTYAGPGAQGPSLFVPNPNQIPGRFLYPSTKDFFAVYSARAPGAPQPW
ncbi:MAG TPA: hypothetical protein VMV53_01155 [Acidimicrobiales bacterium]|nr:hypothetical protein [Acidimicrobiales bacterium]